MSWFFNKLSSFSTQFRHLWEENLLWNTRNFYIWNFWWKTLLALQFFRQADWLTRSGTPTCSCQISMRNFANLFSVKVLTMIWPGPKAQKTKNPKGEFRWFINALSKDLSIHPFSCSPHPKTNSKSTSSKFHEYLNKFYKLGNLVRLFDLLCKSNLRSDWVTVEIRGKTGLCVIFQK